MSHPSFRRLLRLLTCVATFLAAWLLLSSAAPAQQVVHGSACAADQYKQLVQKSFKGSLGCNANDVAITQIAINRNYYPGVNQTPQANLLTGAGCVGGTNVVANLNVTVQFNQPNRYDIGIFLAEDGKDPQTLSTDPGASQACTVSILPLDSGGISNPFGTGTVPTPFLNLNPATGGYCGDGSSTGIPTSAYATATGTPTGTGTATFVIHDVPIPCSTGTGSTTGKLNIPFVVSWSQNAGNACTGPLSVSPGATSKCNVPSGTLGEVDVVALPQITKSDGVSSVSVGDTTTYTITVANTIGSTLPSSTLKDPGVTGLAISAVTCSAAGGSTCPALTTTTFTTGVTLPSMPNNSTLTFTVNGKFTSSGLGTPGSPWVPAPGSDIVNTASVTVSGASNSAIDKDTVYYPSLSNQKTVSVLSDPVRGMVSNALSIPGSVSQYSITVSNSDAVGRVDNDTLEVTDAIPANTYLYYQLNAGATNCSAVGPPVSLAASGTSTLTLAAADVQYYDGTSWSATPSWTFVPALATPGGTVPAGCYASNITQIRARPKGRMAPASSFTLNFNVWVR